MLKLWKILALLILTLVLFAFILFGSSAPEGEHERTDPGNPGERLSSPAPFPEIPPRGGAIVWYLGHCGYAVRTQNDL